MLSRQSRRHQSPASANAMIAALREFRGLEHVMEPAGRIGEVSFVNDSKATNVEAARRSIESFPGRVVALVGGHFKGGDFGICATPSPREVEPWSRWESRAARARGARRPAP